MKSNKSALVVNHHVFLTRDQRYALLEIDKPITVVGVNSPVWLDDGHAIDRFFDEIFCTYLLVTEKEPDPNTVIIVDRGYRISLSLDMAKDLLDFTDNGSECLMLTHRNILVDDGGFIPILHCIDMEDMAHCIDSIN
jgi:hypothetical protein